MSLLRIVFVPRDPQAGAPFLTVDAAGRAVARGVLRSATERLEPARVVAVVPGEAAPVRLTELPPTRSAAQAASAARFLVEDQLAAEREATHAAVSAPDADGRRWTAFADAERVRAWLARLAELGVDPDVLLPEALTLPAPEPGGAVAAETGEALTLVRTGDRAFALETDLVETVLGRSPRRIGDAEREAALITAARAPLVDLRQGAFARSGAEGPSRRRLATLAAAVAVAPLLVWTAEAVRFDMQARKIRSELTENARRTDPNLSRSASLEVLRSGLVRQAGERSGTAGVAALFAAVERVEGARLDMLVLNPDGAVRATLTHGAYADLEAMRAALAASGFDLREDATVEDAGRVVSDVTVGRAR